MFGVRILICDLTHTGAKIATENIPLGAGFIFAYTKKVFGDSVDIYLVKYPEELDSLLLEQRPDIVAFANYVWNNDLNEHYCRRIKSIDGNILTVKGGPNFPVHEVEQIAYLDRYRATDAYIEHEGEIAFVNLVRAYMERGTEWNNAPIDGVRFLGRTDPPSLVSGNPLQRIKNLTEMVPSPYLEGHLDKFFDGKLTPVIQRTRGCPFACNYCNEGVDYYRKINKFDVERTIGELHYIGERASKLGIRNLIITDMNFGMYDEDLLVAQEIAKCRELYNWPYTLLTSTGKNRVDRIADVVKSLKDSIIITMSMQSMNDKVLQAIRRQNIKPEMYVSLAAQMPDQPKQAELIVPLPMETFSSYLDAVGFLSNAGVDKILTYTLQINMGTDYDSRAYLAANGYETRYRAYANCFGIYGGEVVIEAEEVGVATKVFSEADYYQSRKLAFITELIFNNGLFGEYFKFLSDYGVKPFDFLKRCFECCGAENSPIKPAIADFLEETRKELFPTAAALKTNYAEPGNYQRLLNGEEGRNVLYSHKALVMASKLDELNAFVSDNFFSLVDERGLKVDPQELEEIRRYCAAKLHNILLPDACVEENYTFRFDFLKWLAAEGEGLSKFSVISGVELSFFFDNAQILERTDLFTRYGYDVLGIMKIFARVQNHQRLVRKVRYRQADRS